MSCSSLLSPSVLSLGFRVEVGDVKTASDSLWMGQWPPRVPGRVFWLRIEVEGIMGMDKWLAVSLLYTVVHPRTLL